MVSASIQKAFKIIIHYYALFLVIYFKLCFGGHTESLKFHKVIRITVCIVGLLTAVARLDDFCFFSDC